MSDITPEKIEKLLDMEIDTYDFDSITFREWIKAVLKTFFYEEHCFDGKRPFGSSGWTCDIEQHLAYLDPSVIDKVTYHNDEGKTEEVDISDLENTPWEEWPWYGYPREEGCDADYCIWIEDEERCKELFNEIVDYLLGARI